jgi:hypothetical protein
MTWRAISARPHLEARLEYGDALVGTGDYTGALAAYEIAAKLMSGGSSGRKTVSKTGGPPAALLSNCGVLRALTGKASRAGYSKAGGLLRTSSRPTSNLLLLRKSV